MREQLIRYLLGELEPHEHDAVQRQLAESPELRRELSRLRSCFANARQEDEPDEPPRGLAERTATWVSESDSYDALPPRKAGLSEASDAPSGVLGWSLADLTVAGGVMLAVSMLLFPALRNSLDGTRRDMCMNNLHEMGRVFIAYTDNHSGYLDLVQPNENVGMFAVRLVESGYGSDDQLERWLVCPGSPRARLIRANPQRFFVKIPSQAELDAMSPSELAATKEWMSPTYAFPLGYVVGRQYHYPRIHQFRTPIFSDAPSSETHGMSPNHGGSIIQVLYSDGSVGVLTSAKVKGGNDDIFSNMEGDIAAGKGFEDIVLGSSEATPNTFVTTTRRSSSGRMPQRQLLPIERYRLELGN